MTNEAINNTVIVACRTASRVVFIFSECCGRCVCLFRYLFFLARDFLVANGAIDNAVVVTYRLTGGVLLIFPHRLVGRVLVFFDDRRFEHRAAFGALLVLGSRLCASCVRVHYPVGSSVSMTDCVLRPLGVNGHVTCLGELLQGVRGEGYFKVLVKIPAREGIAFLSWIGRQLNRAVLLYRDGRISLTVNDEADFTRCHLVAACGEPEQGSGRQNKNE